MPRYGTHRRTGTYNEWGKTYMAFSQALLNAGKSLNSIATVELQEVADDYLKKVDSEWPHHSEGRSFFDGSIKVINGSKFGGDREHPWYSGQLHDSVAVRIMTGNRLTSVHYMPPSPDTGKPQHTETINNIIGAEWAREIAEAHGPRYLLPGVQVQLIVGVPYADKVNEEGRHIGFADSLADDLFSDVYAWVDEGGLVRPTVIVDDKSVKVVNKSNIKRKK